MDGSSLPPDRPGDWLDIVRSSPTGVTNTGQSFRGLPFFHYEQSTKTTATGDNLPSGFGIISGRNRDVIAFDFYLIAIAC